MNMAIFRNLMWFSSLVDNSVSEQPSASSIRV
jgi:hypothetical protein